MRSSLFKALWQTTTAYRLVSARVRSALWRAQGARLGAKANIGPRCTLDRPWGFSAGARTVLEKDVYVKIVDDNARIEFGDFCFVGAGVEIDVKHHISIGDHSLLAPGCFIVDHTHGLNLSHRIDEQSCTAAPIHIGKDVWVGANAVVLPGVTIGDHAVIGANSVVRENVAAGSIVGGVPAKPLRMR